MTLTEYLAILKCDENDNDMDPSKMNKEFIEQLEARHEDNKKKRQEKGIVASPSEFVNG